MMKTKLFLAAGVALGALSVSAPAIADGEIKIGDINSYTRLPAHTIPYRRGATLAIPNTTSSPKPLRPSPSQSVFNTQPALSPNKKSPPPGPRPCSRH